MGLCCCLSRCRAAFDMRSTSGRCTFRVSYIIWSRIRQKSGRSTYCSTYYLRTMIDMDVFEALPKCSNRMSILMPLIGT